MYGLDIERVVEIGLLNGRRVDKMIIDTRKARCSGGRTNVLLHCFHQIKEEPFLLIRQGIPC